MGEGHQRIEIIEATKSPALRNDVYLTAAKFGDLVFMTGQVAVDPATNKLVKGDFEVQCRRACENLRLALEDAGTSVDNILTMRFFLRDLKDYPILAKVRREYFPTRPPSTTVAVVGIGPGGKGRIEVDCIAARGK